MSFWSKKRDENEEGESLGVASPLEPGPSVVSGPAVADSEGTGRRSTASSLEERIAERYGKLRSALGSGTVIQGKLSFDTSVRIDGKLGGEIFSSRALIVGASGIIDAQVEVQSLVVMGSVKGNIKATERVELLAGGTIEGDVVAPIFLMEEGATLSGQIKISGINGTEQDKLAKPGKGVELSQKGERKGEPESGRSQGFSPSSSGKSTTVGGGATPSSPVGPAPV